MELFWWCGILTVCFHIFAMFIAVLLIGMEIAYGIEPSVGIYQMHIPFNFSTQNN
jgi:hypothetical protein